MDCSTGSIASLCLQAPAHSLAQGFAATSDRPVIDSAQQPQLIQSWIRENMSGSDVDSRLLDNLKRVVLEVGFLKCRGCKAERIVCNHFLF